MKKLAIILGSLFSVIVIVVAIVNIYSWHKSRQYQDTAVPYIKAVIPEISKWDMNSLKGHMAPKVLEQTTDEKFTKVIGFFSKLGGLKSFDNPDFVKAYTGSNPEEGTQTIVTYTVEAVYENGDAEITLALLESGSSFKIYKFHIRSIALLE